ncbi:hypothetical protein KEJ23_04025 [Candidatus Bathyarchaeota archaeon]|nr:hypothetical protein [Candidatus Bathyarchaeota archaeon]
MSTIQVDENVKKMLFTFAAELQQKAGRRISLSEAIGHLLETYQKSQRDKGKILSLFGCLRGEDVQTLLIELRRREERRLEAFTGKPHP